MKSKFFFSLSPDRLPPKNFMISFLIYWLLAERFSSGKRFRQDFYPHSAFSSFSCFKNTFLGTFSSGQIGTSLLPGRMVYILEPSLLPGRMVYILEPSLLPGRMVYILEPSLLPGRMVYILEPSLLPGRMVQFFNSHQSFFPNRWFLSKSTYGDT